MPRQVLGNRLRQQEVPPEDVQHDARREWTSASRLVVLRGNGVVLGNVGLDRGRKRDLRNPDGLRRAKNAGLVAELMSLEAEVFGDLRFRRRRLKSDAPRGGDL